VNAPLVVIGGPSGVGKTTVGQLLAKTLEIPFCDADDLHSAENIARMSAGVGLDDAARAPWLARVGCWLVERQQEGGLVACSALAERYRETLRTAAPQVRFAMLRADVGEIAVRLERRHGHFMAPELLGQQLALYEPPASGEPAAEFDAGPDPRVTAGRIAEWLAAGLATSSDVPARR
jgi:gluconokinase